MRRNEWGSLAVPEVGAWEPTLSVSVVVPAYDAGRLLPYVLAGLAAQSYPDHLLEVVVVDDGPGILALPEVRPERTRLVRVDQGWGRANACHQGALVAEGEVLHWLDADMLAERTEVEAQLRWHHLLDHVAVLGDKWFVDPAPVLARTPAEVRAVVEADEVGSWWGQDERTPHTWVEEVYGRTDDLREAGWFALRTHTGACASVRRDTYLAAGGMDTTLRLGEDISLGARLGEVGCVFVPDREALSWHLGPTHVMERREQVNAYNDPFFADASPVLRAKRRPGRTYAVPYLDVVLDVRELEVADVVATVDAVLASSLHDLRVTLLGDFATLSDERMALLDDPSLPTRIVQQTYGSDPRVRLLSALPAGRSDTPFRLTLPGATFAPRRAALEELLLHLEHTHDGLRLIDLRDGTVARLERTAAVERAARVVRLDEDLDAVLDEVAGSARIAGRDAGFGPSTKVSPAFYPRTGGPAIGSEEAWTRIDEQLAPRGIRSARPSGQPDQPAKPGGGHV
ncbi:glycosyltransferase family A protein [Nocardioides sp.]|uniref:glycosyltransferase family A protein n=1 Tax=Nocardioides sp. TaxID=35761 RepID=UPI002B271529|nr:glycosyltransferase family A protein [Nocardioides sp.]